MAELLRMPAAVAGQTDAVLTAWLVDEGIAFAAQDVVATVETAKASFDVAAESDGVLLRRLVAEGAEVAAGDPIAVTGSPGETGQDASALLSRLGPAPSERKEGNENGRIFTSPLARRLAREAGLSVGEITGTGPNGRIIRRDVEAAIKRRAALGPAPAPAPAPAGAAAISDGSAAESGAPGFTDTPHSRMRQAIAARLAESKRVVPHFYLRATPDVRELCLLRDRLNAAGGGKVTLTHLLLKAVAHAHVQVPAMNVIWTPDAVRRFDTVDLSVAIATDDGLVAPVIRSVEQLSVSRIAAITGDLAGRARAGRLRPDELTGGTATVSNLGMHGTEEFAAIINPPQSAVLAVGAVREAPVVREGEVRAGHVMTLTLSVDHRPIDGATAARWMQAFTARLEDPIGILL